MGSVWRRDGWSGWKAGLWLFAVTTACVFGCTTRYAQAISYVLIEKGSTVPLGPLGIAGFDPFLETHMFSDQTAGAYMQTFTVGQTGNLSTLTWNYALQNPTSSSYDVKMTFQAYNLGPGGYTGQSLAPGSNDVLWSFDLTGGYPLTTTVEPTSGQVKTGAFEATGSGPPNIGTVTAGDVIAVVSHAWFADPSAVPSGVRFGRPYGRSGDPAPYPDGQAYQITADGTVVSASDRDYWVQWEIYSESAAGRTGTGSTQVPEPGALGFLAIAALLFAVRAAAERRGAQA